MIGPLSVGINIGSHWNSYEKIPAYLYSASFGISITDNIDSFVEYYGDVSSLSSAENHLDENFLYCINKIGIVPNEIIKVKEKRLFDKSMEIIIRDKELNITNIVAENIFMDSDI